MWQNLLLYAIRKRNMVALLNGALADKNTELISQLIFLVTKIPKQKFIREMQVTFCWTHVT